MDAQEKLAKETDFFKFLKLLRVTDFMSKVTLKKYQRSLIPYFKKYSLAELEGDTSSKTVFTTERSATKSLLEGEECADLIL